MITGLTRRALVAAAAASAMLVPSAGTAEPALCSWGGTPMARTGTFTAEPGFKNTPSTVPIHIRASGIVAGSDARCTGVASIDGTVAVGSSCLAFRDEGTVIGIPGVATFTGGGGAYSHSVLFAPDGSVAGEIDVLARSNDQIPFTESCASDEGLTEGTFAGVIGLKLL